MIRINLLPVREARRRADLQQQGVLLVLLLVVTFAGIGYAHYSISSDVSLARLRVVATQNQIKKYDAQLKQVEEYKKKKKEVQNKLDVIHGLDRSRSGPVRVLDELATRTPERLWLRELKANGDQLSIEGMSLDNEVVAVFLTELNNSAYFKDVELKQTELESKGGLKLHHFSVKAVVTDPERDKPKAESAQNDKKPAGNPGTAAGGTVGR